ENFHVLRPVQVVFFRDERAIAIQKNSSVHFARKVWSERGKNGIEILAVACSMVCLCGWQHNNSPINHMSNKGRLGILVGGGPAPGLNGVIAAATIEGIN